MEPLDPYLASLADLSGLRILQDETDPSNPPDFNFDNIVAENTAPILDTNTTSSIKNTTS